MGAKISGGGGGGFTTAAFLDFFGNTHRICTNRISIQMFNSKLKNVFLKFGLCFSLSLYTNSCLKRNCEIHLPR